MPLWLVPCRGDILLTSDNAVPAADAPPVSTTRRSQPLPRTIGGMECRGIEVDDPTITPAEMHWMPLRKAFSVLTPEMYGMAAKAVELAWFDRNTRFCSLCGAPMRWHTDISKRCTECHKEQWPQLATAIIVRVERGDEVLLVRANNFRGDFYGLVAGFVETGESLEDCVRREVMEETGLEIADIRYYGSQAWPYPSGLMVGFTAQYAGGTLRLQRSELSGGGWFRRDNMPSIPDYGSISRMLIDDWMAQKGKQQPNI